MRAHVDWITFTMAPRYGTYDTEGMSAGDDYAKAIEQAWFATFDAETLAACFGGEWTKMERSRAPYSDAWSLPEAGIILYAGISLNHCCVEITGAGCEKLITHSLLERVLAAVAERVTRVDVACDIDTDVEPENFVEKRTHRRFQADGYQNSRSGKTRYVGSKKSDRFARVYRYAKPHPRAHLLRVEHVFHKAYAKSVARAIVMDGVDAVSRASGIAFGWAHDVWQTEEAAFTDISVTTEKRDTGKTVFWLCTSVASAFKRLCDDGTIPDAQDFLNRYFLSDM